MRQKIQKFDNKDTLRPLRSDKNPLSVGKNFRNTCDQVMVFIVIIMFVAICIMSNKDVLWPGDCWSDLNVILSGENLAKYGFFKLHFLDVHHVGPLSDTPEYYLHYPPLPSLIYGFLHRAGIQSLAIMRIICGSLSVIGVICIYRAFIKVMNPLAVTCGLGFLITTRYFFSYGVSIHAHTYNLFFLGLFFLFFLRSINEPSPGKWGWLGCWIVLFLHSLTTYEFILYTQIFAWVYVIATKQMKQYWYILVFLGTAPVVGVGLHFLQNCWAIGFSAAISDNLGFNASHGGLSYERVLAWRKMPRLVLKHSSNFYRFSLLTMIIFMSITSIFKNNMSPSSQRKKLALFCGILVATPSWYLFMPTHTVVHPHVTNQLLPLVIVAVGSVVAVFITTILNKNINSFVRILVALTLLSLAGTQAIGVYHRLNSNKINNSLILKAIGPEGLPSNAGYLFNSGLSSGPFFSYFTKRPVAAWTWQDNNILLRENVKAFQKHAAPGWPYKYCVFYGVNDYTKKRMFRSLASTCEGRKKTFKLHNKQEQPGSLILFDMSPLYEERYKDWQLPSDVREKQLQGIFPEWEIEGFDQRLARQVGFIN